MPKVWGHVPKDAHLIDKSHDTVDVVRIVLLDEAVPLEQVVIRPRTVADENLLSRCPRVLHSSDAIGIYILSRECAWARGGRGDIKTCSVVELRLCCPYLIAASYMCQHEKSSKCVTMEHMEHMEIAI